VFPGFLDDCDLGTIAVTSEHLRIIDTHSADIVGQRCGGKEARSCAVVLIGVLVQDDTGNDGSDGGTMRRPSGETRSLV